MSDISTANTAGDSKLTASKSDVDWTVVGSNQTSPTQSTAFPSPPLPSRSPSPGDELATVTPSSPAQSLVESEEADPKSLSSLATDDLISPIATPLPASPVDENSSSGGINEGLSTPVDSEWARSKLAIAEGEEDGKSSIGASDFEGEGEEKVEEECKKEGKEGNATGDAKDVNVETAVPSLIFTKPTLNANEIIAKAETSELPYAQPKKENETSDESDKTDVPPLVNRINTRLAPSFLQDTQDHLFESPTTTNNAAPNSAVSPKTTSFFFDTSRIRSPPRHGGATIVELPSDADTLGAESEGPRSRTMISNGTQTSDEEQEKPSSHSTCNKTIPLISPDHSSDRPDERKVPIETTSRSPRPPFLTRKPSPHYVSTFSRDHSPAPRPRLDHRSRSRETRRHIEKGGVSSSPRPDSFFRSRTFVSTSAPQSHKSRPTPAEKKEEVAKNPMSITSLVEEIKGALSRDSTVYYTLKGVLAEHEEKNRFGTGREEESARKERVVEKNEVDPDFEFVKAEKEKFLRRQSAKNKQSAPVKSFSYTQTDSDSSEAETYKLPQHHRRSSSSFLRQLVLPSLNGQPPHSGAIVNAVEVEKVGVRRAQHGSRAVPLRTAPPPHSPVYPSRLSPRPSHAPTLTRSALPPTAAGAKSSAVLKSVKLGKPSSISAIETSSRLALERQLSAAKGIAISSLPRTTSSTSALLNRPDLSPQKRSTAKSIISPSRPLIQPPSSFQFQSGVNVRVEQIGNAAKSGGKEKKKEVDRKRRSEGMENVERRKRLVAKGGKTGEKGKVVEKGKGKEKERENSISFDFDDFY